MDLIDDAHPASPEPAPPPTLETLAPDDYIAVRNRQTTLKEIAERPPATSEQPPEPEPEPEPGPEPPEPFPDDQAASAAGSTLAKRRNPEKRINQAIAKQRAAEAAAQQALARAQQLEAELAAARTVAPPAPGLPPSAPEPAPAASPYAKPMPKREDIGTKYPTYEDYSEALAVWSAEEGERRGREAALQVEQDRVAEQQRRQFLEHQQTRATAHNERLTTFIASHPDFNTVLSNLQHIDVPRVVTDALIDSPTGPAILYHLANDLEQAERLSTLAPIDAIRAIGRLEARLGDAPDSGSPSGTPPVTRAAAPIKPVGAAPTASTVPLDQMDPDTYIEVRNRETRAMGRR